MKIEPDNIPVLTVKSMNLRWGSISAQKKLFLNLSLIQAPLECIEYVILHELCHLEKFHHGPEFYRNLEKILPDWKFSDYVVDSATVAALIVFALAGSLLLMLFPYSRKVAVIDSVPAG